MAESDSETSLHAQHEDASSGEKRFQPAAIPEKGILLGWLRQMLLIREFEVRTMQAYQNRMIGGFCHIYIGQEAIAVGSIAAVNPDDPIVLAYRDHGHALARGMDPKNCMAEMFGRIGGCAKGKGGSMHMFDADHHLYGGHGIVGAQTPLGVGLAFATKYEDEVINGGNSHHVTLCYLGDGTLNQGAFHEAMNLASLFDMPVIFVLENNGIQWEHRSNAERQWRIICKQNPLPMGLTTLRSMAKTSSPSTKISNPLLSGAEKNPDPTSLKCRPIGTRAIPCRILGSIEQKKKSPPRKMKIASMY